LDDADLQQLYRRGTSRIAGKPHGCPSDEALLKVLTGAATSLERQALADHLVRCSDCAEEYRIASDLKPWAAAAADRLAPVQGAPQRSGFRLGAPQAGSWRPWLGAFSWRRVATVTAVLALTLGGVALWQTMPPAPASDRGRSSMTLSAQPPDRAVLPSPPDVLAWSAVPGAESYQVILYDFESTPVWESPPITDARVSLPADTRGAIQPGTPYYWRIIVSIGIDRVPSDLFQFTVTAR